MPQSMNRGSVLVSLRGLRGGGLAPEVNTFQNSQTSRGSATKILPLDVERLADSAAGAAAAGAADAADAADAAAAGAAITCLCAAPFDLALAAGAALWLPASGGGGVLPWRSLLLLLAAAIFSLATSTAAATLLPDAPADPRGVVGGERVERGVVGFLAAGAALSLRLAAPWIVGAKPPPL